jgi:ubiquitin carboxyl-terminal hydrolase 5/13
MGEDGQSRPIFGPDFTGLKNLGNSCYINSVLQALFAMPEFATRYGNAEMDPTLVDKPGEDLETQLEKLAKGLLSGRYSKPDADVTLPEDAKEEPHQKGLAPSMLKVIVGKGHEEFSSMRQQDSFEFLIHLLELITRSKHPSPLLDPVQFFKFALEERLQCNTCHKVRYHTDEQANVIVPLPKRELPKSEEDGKDEYETVAFQECLDMFTTPVEVEYKCPECQSTGYSKRSRFSTLPKILAVNVQRFGYKNWVPTKMDVPVNVSDDVILFDQWMSGGPQPGEELLPEDAAIGGAQASATASNAFVPNAEALMMLESMGFPRVRCEKALHATGNGDAEAASFWLMEHMEDPDIDVPMEQPGAKKGVQIDEASLGMLTSMGFSVPQARQAMKETNGDVERSVEWLFSHPDATGNFGEDEEPAEAPAAEKKLAGSDSKPARYELQSIVCHKGGSIHAG